MPIKFSRLQIGGHASLVALPGELQTLNRRYADNSGAERKLVADLRCRDTPDAAEAEQTFQICLPLTGLFNRRYMAEKLTRELFRAKTQRHVGRLAVYEAKHSGRDRVVSASMRAEKSGGQ